MTFLNQLRIGKLFIQLVIDPSRTELIFAGVRVFAKDADQSTFSFIENTFLKQAEFQARLNEKYNPPTPSNEELRQYPTGTFGAALYNHLHSHQLSLELFPRPDFSRPIEYLALRAYQDHDLWHTLLGYGIEVEDELAVQAFAAGQYGSPVGLLLIAGGLLHLLRKSPARAVKALEEIAQAFNIGKSARLLAGMRLHDCFSMPLHEVQKMCGLPPIISPTNFSIAAPATAVGSQAVH